jgi:hypothetical protein
MQSLDVEGDVSALRAVEDEEMDGSAEEMDDDITPTAMQVPYERDMSPEPFGTLTREDTNLTIVDQWDDWAEIVSDCDEFALPL